MPLNATKAIVRELPRTYDVLYSKRPRPVSLERAASQHGVYMSTLHAHGLAVTTVPADRDKPDSVFVEDTAVVWGNDVLICRMNSDREGEQAAVADSFRKTHRVHFVTAPATLEGGDVLHVDDLTYVGISSRTNEAGAEQLANFLARFGRRVVGVPVTRCLHLKTGATYLGNRTLLVAPNLMEHERFARVEILETAPDEPGSANTLRLANSIVIPAGYPSTERRLREFAGTNGLEMICLDISEFEKGDGSLSCLSIVW